MVDLSAEQLELKSSIQKSATTWGVVLGLIVAIIAYFVLGSQGTLIQLAGAVILGGAAGFGVYRWQFGSQSKSAQCGKCNSAFSISRTDHQETLTGSEDKVDREPQDDGSAKVTRYTEQKFDVVDTYTCASCGDVTTKEYKTTRRENVQEKIDPAPVTASEAAPAGAINSSKAIPTADAEASAPKTAPSGGLGRGGAGSSR